MRTSGCSPLTPGMVSLLQDCIEYRTLNESSQASRRFVSSGSVHACFGRICQRLNARSRFEAVIVAAELRIVKIPRLHCPANTIEKYCLTYSVAIISDEGPPNYFTFDESHAQVSGPSAYILAFVKAEVNNYGHA